MSIYYLQIN